MKTIYVVINQTLKEFILFIKKAERGCKMITLETDIIRDFVFKDYLSTKHFVNGFVAYTLSQAMSRVTTQNFGKTSDVANLIVMENYVYQSNLKDFLASEELTTTFFYHVMQYINPDLVEKPISGSPSDNIVAKRQVDFLEYLSAPLEQFFNELINRTVGKFSNYDDKLILVNADLATPGILAVSYKTVIKTPKLAEYYRCYIPQT